MIGTTIPQVRSEWEDLSEKVQKSHIVNDDCHSKCLICDLHHIININPVQVLAAGRGLGASCMDNLRVN